MMSTGRWPERPVSQEESMSAVIDGYLVEPVSALPCVPEVEAVLKARAPYAPFVARLAPRQGRLIEAFQQ